MRKLLLNKDYPLEERMVFFVYLTLIVSNFVIIMMNAVDNIPFYKNFKWMGFILFLVGTMIFYARCIRLRRIIRNISFGLILYILFPALYIFSGGLRTAAVPYMIILLLALIYSFKGKIRILMVVSYILLSVGLMTFFYLNPGFFPPVSDDTMYLDWLMNFPVILIIIAMLSMWVSNEHKYERDKAVSFSREMEELSRNDTLTGIFNRRYLENRANELSEECENVIFFIFDIDRFKQINDSKGHDEGDRILVSVAKIMTNVFYSMTSIRFGGDEFLIMGSGCNMHDFKEKVKRFRKLLEWELGITISGGVVIYNGAVSESLKKGDMLLYQAKQAGRNKVIFED